VHKPLVTYEKNLGCSACLFAELSSIIEIQVFEMRRHVICFFCILFSF